MFRLAALLFRGLSGSDRFRRSKTRRKIFSSALSLLIPVVLSAFGILFCSKLREYMIRICENLFLMMMSMLDVRPGRVSTTYICINPLTSGSTSRVGPRCGTHTPISALLSKSSEISNPKHCPCAFQSASVGSQSVTKYSSKPSIVFISSAPTSNPSTFPLATILSFVTLLGKGTYPCCRLHLIKSCAGVQAYLFDNSTIFGCFIRRARASGAYASTTISCWAQNEVISVRVLKGWTSI
jgi:hypothetical protein